MPVVAANANLIGKLFTNVDITLNEFNYLLCIIVEPEILRIPTTYTTVFGVQRATEIIRDDVGFLNYKNKTTETKM